jgi:hypothetical protein
LALAPLIGITACVALRAQVARSGGNSRSSIQSMHSSTSTVRQHAFSHGIEPLLSAPEASHAARRQ